MRLQQMHFRGKKIWKTTNLLLFHVQPMRLFHMSGIQRRFRTFVITKRKTSNIVCTNPVLQNDKK